MPGQRNLDAVKRYYHRTESRLGYWYLLGGTKHFGFYRPGDRPWKFDEAMRRMEELLVETLQVQPGAQILDAGSGMGRVALHVARSTGAHVTGIDILDFNVVEARRLSKAAGLESQTSFLVGDYSDTKFDDYQFDAVYTVETLVHASDPVSALEEFYRVLKPGGVLVNLEYARAPDASMPRRAVGIFRRMNELAAMPAFNQFTYGTQERLLRERGFEVVSAQDITMNMLPMLRMFAIIGRVPYAVVRLLRKSEKGINTMSGVEMWRYRPFWRYMVYRSRRPM